MKFLNFLTAAATEGSSGIIFEPGNFLYNLKYMGLGMLVIFVVIGIIILVTMMINKLFAE
jgi:1,4-dihydroxy-2-naphthoate octaprenyltransferase